MTVIVPNDLSHQELPGELAKALRLAAVTGPEDSYISVNICLPVPVAREIARRIDYAVRRAPVQEPSSGKPTGATVSWRWQAVVFAAPWVGFFLAILLGRLS
ncbi:hypothetical protein ACFO5X_07320 [Seohaeicola nanhaiensis]|uniref:Uncharacterized protein n=1 Tax=Seohaeicola nanhaiensis TaxID=1387282 RepID=A0ABV9KE09_9RHOB